MALLQIPGWLKRGFAFLGVLDTAKGIWGVAMSSGVVGGVISFVEGLPWIVIFGSFIAMPAIFLLLFNEIKRLKRERSQQFTREELAEALMRSQPAPPPLELQFGNPFQDAEEPYLSWWHVPVKLVGGPGGEKFEQCQAELLTKLTLLGSGKVTEALRWQTPDDENGKSQITILKGNAYNIPLAIRCEISDEAKEKFVDIADGIARVTGVSYLRDKNYDAVKLTGSYLEFRIRVTSGESQWESKPYKITLPQKQNSNGHFIMSKEDF